MSKRKKLKVLEKQLTALIAVVEKHLAQDSSNQREKLLGEKTERETEILAILTRK